MKENKLTVRDICTISIFTVTTAAMAQISIPLPFTPVPISFGLVAVYMTGILLQPKQALFAQITYLLLGGVGLPVFANFKGGLGAILGPTGGFLMAFPIMAFIVSASINNPKRPKKEELTSKWKLYIKVTVAMCLSHLLLYIMGTLWFSTTTHTSLTSSLVMTVFPFIPMDIIKIALCAILFIPFRRRLIRMGLLTFTTTVTSD